VDLMEKYFSVGNAKPQVMDNMWINCRKQKACFPQLTAQICPQPWASITKLQSTLPQAPQLRLLLSLNILKQKTEDRIRGG